MAIGRYRWLELGEGARKPLGNDGDDLLRRLNNAAREVQAHVKITSGRRTNYEQWLAYQDYLAGGILAAPCCSLGSPHQWSRCLKQCMSNHCASRAVDCVVKRRGVGWVNLGEWQKMRDAMRAKGLCLPVGYGETWHVEVGNRWES